MKEKTVAFNVLEMFGAIHKKLSKSWSFYKNTPEQSIPTHYWEFRKICFDVYDKDLLY